MSDHFKFEVRVEVYDMAHIEQDYRGQELKDACKEAVGKVLEENGYRAYRHEYYVGA